MFKKKIEKVKFEGFVYLCSECLKRKRAEELEIDKNDVAICHGCGKSDFRGEIKIVEAQREELVRYII